MRVDFNVSVNDGVIGEDYRIRMAIPTIEYLAKRGAKVILASHLGRPKTRDQTKSLEPVAKRLGEILGNSRVSVLPTSSGSTSASTAVPPKVPPSLIVYCPGIVGINGAINWPGVSSPRG